MADLSAEALEREVKDILKGADLSTVTSKVIRKKIEEKLGCDLSDRREEIDAIIMADVEDQVSSEGDVSEEEAAPPARRKAAKSDSDGEQDDDYNPEGGAKKGRKPKAKKRKAGGEDGDSDEDWGKKKKAKKAAGAGGAKKQSAFTKSFRLSPELADVVGADVMPRHEVVKKLWAVIKERKLQDPKQKQFAICDDQLMKIFGIKRFRTFGMMKYLKDHFVEAV